MYKSIKYEHCVSVDVILINWIYNFRVNWLAVVTRSCVWCCVQGTASDRSSRLHVGRSQCAHVVRSQGTLDNFSQVAAKHTLLSYLSSPAASNTTSYHQCYHVKPLFIILAFNCQVSDMPSFGYGRFRLDEARSTTLLFRTHTATTPSYAIHMPYYI